MSQTGEPGPAGDDLAVGRLVTAMVTPFTDDGELDRDGAARLADHLVTTGTDTVLVSGTTGESPTVPADEGIAVLETVVETVAGRATVMFGSGTNDTAKTVAVTRRAAGAGADAVLVVTPYYNKPNQRGLAYHFRTVARATELPVVLYDIPGRTGREIARDTLVALAEVPNIIGVKDAVGDLAKTAVVVADTPPDFHVWCGTDVYNLPMLAVGARGFVSVAAHVAGPLLADMIASFPTAPVKAREIHQRLLPLCEALFLEPNPAPLKALLRSLGLPSGPVRPPLVDAEADTLQALEDALEGAGISW